MKLGYKRYTGLSHTRVEYDGSYCQFWFDNDSQKIVFQDRNKNDSWVTRIIPGSSVGGTSILPIIMLSVGNLPLFNHFNVPIILILSTCMFFIIDFIYLSEEYFGIKKQPLKSFISYEQMQIGHDQLMELIFNKAKQKRIEKTFGVLAMVAGMILFIFGDVSGISWFIYLLGCGLFSDGLISRAKFLGEWLKSNR